MTSFKLKDQQKITTGFKIPEHYFEDFSARIMHEIQKPQEVKVVPLQSGIKKTWLYFAAALLITALVLPLYTNYESKKVLDTESIENYISYQSNISQYDLINLLDNHDIDKLNIDINLEKKSIEDILVNSADLENYLTD